MKMQYYVDENVLALLMKTQGKAWQAVYSHYRGPFVSYFRIHHGVEAQKGQQVFQEVFSLLAFGLKEGIVCTPLGNTVFAYLVRFGEEKLRNSGYPITFTSVPFRTYPAGEVIGSLTGSGHKAACSAIIKHYADLLSSEEGLESKFEQTIGKEGEAGSSGFISDLWRTLSPLGVSEK